MLALKCTILNCLGKCKKYNTNKPKLFNIIMNAHFQQSQIVFPSYSLKWTGCKIKKIEILYTSETRPENRGS